MNGPPGDPYDGFNKGQAVETEFLRFSLLEAIAVHSASGIYAFGTTWDTLDGTGKTAVISKYLATGALDISYDRDGKLYLNGSVIGGPAAFDLSGVDMLVQPNEQLVF